MKDAGGNLLISGLIPADQRGAISGKASGSPAGHETVVALSNAEAQYWDMADAAGNYSITGVLPGTYTETLYSNELAVGTRTVTITAGQTTRADITSTYFTPGSNLADRHVGRHAGRVPQRRQDRDHAPVRRADEQLDVDAELRRRH